MLHELKSALILITVLVGLVAGRNGCRQCLGMQRVIFDHHISEQQATDFFRKSLGECATGNDYQITAVLSNWCQYPCLEQIKESNRTLCKTFGTTVCTTWGFQIKVWRFCGNGSRAIWSKGRHCIDGLCATNDDLGLSCTQSVECRGTCHCNLCGC